MNLDLTTEDYSGVKKILFKLKPLRNDGLLLNVCNSKSNKIRFLYAHFHEHKSLLALVDNCNNFVIIDYGSCKFWRLPKLESCTHLTFSSFNQDEVVIGTTVGDLLIIKYESGSLSGNLQGHQHPIKNVSFSDRHCLSSSKYEAILWDLRTNSKVQVLHLEKNNTLKFVTFVPVSSNILTCFHDDFIQIWNMNKFQSVKQFLPESWDNYSLKSLTFTKSGQSMVVAGFLPCLKIFSVDTWTVSKSITLPENVLTVRQLEFVSQPFDGGCNKVLAVLSGHGVVYFYDIEQNTVLSELSGESQIVKFAASTTGRYIACIMCSGEMRVHNLEKYTSPVVDVQIQKMVTVDKKKIQQKHLKETQAIKTQINCVLETARLKSVLEKYGQYPESHRLKIWETLLQLPNNIEQYNNVINHNVVSAFEELYAKYPLENKMSIIAVKKLLNNVVTWCPFFANVDFLPVLVYPFVKVFQNKPVACFEAICTLIGNWCQHWFEYYPLPPVNILAITENILLQHDPELLLYFRHINVTSVVYILVLLETAFSEVLSASDWVCLWDHVLTNEISFLYCAVAAYNITYRHILMSTDAKNLDQFFHKQHPLNMKKFIKTTYNLMNTCGENLHPRQYLEDFTAIKPGEYPTYVDYPKVALDVGEKCQEMDKELSKVFSNKKELLAKVMKKRGEKEREIRNEQRKRLKEMEHQYLEKLQFKENILKSEKQKFSKMKLLLGSEDKLTFKQEIDQNFNDSDPSNEVKGYLDQLKTLLYQKQKIDCLLKDKPNGDEIHWKLLEKTIKEIQSGSSVSAEKLRKLCIATSLTILEKVIQNVETELETESDQCCKSVYTLKSLQEETKVLECEIRKLLMLLSENHASGEGH